MHDGDKKLPAPLPHREWLSEKVRAAGLTIPERLSSCQRTGKLDTERRGVREQAAVILPKDRQARSEARDLRVAVIPTVRRERKGNQKRNAVE